MPLIPAPSWRPMADTAVSASRRGGRGFVAMIDAMAPGVMRPNGLWSSAATARPPWWSRPPWRTWRPATPRRAEHGRHHPVLYRRAAGAGPRRAGGAGARRRAPAGRGGGGRGAVPGQPGLAQCGRGGRARAGGLPAGAGGAGAGRRRCLRGHRNRRLQPGVPGRRQGPAAGGGPRHSVGGQHHLHSAGAGRISIHLHRLHRQEL